MRSSRSPFLPLLLMTLTALVVSGPAHTAAQSCPTAGHAIAGMSPASTVNDAISTVSRPGYYDYIPSVMLDGGTYKMWWCGDSPNRPYNDNIYYSDAAQLSGPWSTPALVLSPRGSVNQYYDSGHTCDPSVVKHNGVYYMYYGALPIIDGAALTVIGVATSTDGLNWTRPFTQPIISSSERQPSAENRYGVGYVSAMRVGPYFYLFFVDTLGADSNAGNGAGIYVRRSTDPLFQSSVEELVADNPDLNSSTYPPPGQVRWAVPTPANRTTYALFQAFQVDWTFSPATIEFVAAHPVGGGCFTRQPSTVPGCEIRFKFFPLALDNPPVSGYGWWDMQPNAEFGQPMNWNGRPTVVGTTERHVRTSPDGRYLKLDTIRGVGDACVPGGPNYPTCFGAWDLAGASLEMDTGLTGSCAVDLDSDGMPNLQELENLRNPSGGAVNYLAEGSTGGSLSMATTIGLSNPSTTPATAAVRLQRDDGTQAVSYVTVPSRGHRRVEAGEMWPNAAFSALVEAPTAAGLVVDRTMTIGDVAYSGHSEVGQSEAATTWYLAEGSTGWLFDLFYLIQNPGDSGQWATVTYLFPDPQQSFAKSYWVAARSRQTIWGDVDDPRLQSTDVSAVVSAPSPIVVERAMYLSQGGSFQASHAAAGLRQPLLTWYFAEGATGDFFDTFLLIANPQDNAANVTVTYYFENASPIVRTYNVAGKSRFNVWTDYESIPAGAMAMKVVSSSPVLAERAMWWPGPSVSTWNEAHVSAGAGGLGTRWVFAGGRQGGAAAHSTYVTLLNPTSIGATVTMSLLREGLSPVSIAVDVPANRRHTVDIAARVPGVTVAFGGEVVSTNGTPIYVERSTYWHTNPTWTGGANSGASLR